MNEREFTQKTYVCGTALYEFASDFASKHKFSLVDISLMCGASGNYFSNLKNKQRCAISTEIYKKAVSIMGIDENLIASDSKTEEVAAPTKTKANEQILFDIEARLCEILNVIRETNKLLSDHMGATRIELTKLANVWTDEEGR